MTLAPNVAREVRRVDSEVAASQIRPLNQYLSDSLAPRRFGLSLMAAFGVAALLLALTGIYAVVAYSVTQRAREIGIRIALGASRASILRLVIGQGVRFVAVGVVLGLFMALGAVRLISTLLFDVSATDAGTFAQVTAIVAIASLLACTIPAMRIRKGDGTALLRP